MKKAIVSVPGLLVVRNRRGLNMLLFYISLIESDDDKTKFEIVYDEYKNLMFYVANEILGDTKDSEDVVHDAFLKVIKIIDGIHDPRCPQTKNLVVTIVERTAIDLYRKRKRRQIIPLDEETINVPTSFETDYVIERSSIARAIAMLPTRYRELLLLKYDSGLSEKEISEVLAMTEANVHKTIQRAKKRLSEALEKEVITDDHIG